LASSVRARESFRLGAWRVDPGLCEIADGERVARVEPRAMAVLCHLATRAGETVARDELLDAVWGNRFVVEEAVSRCISQLRQALGDDPREPRYIQTVPKIGYRLLPAVEPADSPAGKAESGTSPGAVPRFRRAVLGSALLVVVAAVAVIPWLQSREGPAASAPRAIVQQRSVAVLPFVAIGGNPRDELLADGMTEEIIHLLASVPGLHVTSRTSSFHFKGREASVEEIARQLGVAHVLEGSVRSDDERFRVTVQLIDVAADAHIWSEAFEGELAGFLEVQKAIATAVAQRLNLSLDRRLLTGEPATHDLAAWQLFVEAWLAVERFDERSIRDGIRLFEAALERDAQFGNAWSGLALARWVLPAVSDMTLEEIAQSDRLALVAAERAAELTPMTSSARFVLADSARVRHDFAEAETRYRDALASLPGEAILHYGYSNVLANVGRTRAALAEAQVNQRLDPLSPVGAYTVAQSWLLLGNEAEARRHLRRSRDLGNENRVLEQAEAYLHLRARDYAAARATVADLHDAAESEAMLAVIEALEDPAQRQSAVASIASLPPWTIQPFRGRLYAALLLGERELAWQAAEEGVALGLEPTLHWWLPEASILRSDPRFAALAERLNLLPYWRERGWPDACRASGAELTCR